MTIRLNLPPTLRELLQDKSYRQYFLTVPTPTIGQTWQVWGLKYNEKWAGKVVETYREGVGLVKQLLAEKETYRDVAIISKTSEYAPPHGSSYRRWCGRCRRPTLFLPNPRHPSLRGAKIISDPTANRCFFCGIREEMHHFYLQ